MPEMDLDPGDYRERKPEGWRWRLPWSHPQDTKLPMVLFFVCLAAMGWVFVNRANLSSEMLFLGGVLTGLGAGGQFILWLGRD